MYRFWKDVTQPCLRLINAKKIVEVGCDSGENTVLLADFCKENGGCVYTIDPSPRMDIDVKLKDYKGFYEFYRNLSLNILWKLDEYDAILIDGDHNWYTVYHELQMIERVTKRLPLILFHDIGWPYDRRDLYYAPENIPSEFIKPYKKLGIDPDSNELSVNARFNGAFFNSIEYSNDKCGVLTAIEDHISNSKYDLEFIKIPLFNGLGILYDKNAEYPQEFINFVRSLPASKPIDHLMEQTNKYFAHEREQLRFEQEKSKEFEKDLEISKSEFEKSKENFNKKQIEKQIEKQTLLSQLEQNLIEKKILNEKYKKIEIKQEESEIILQKKNDLEAQVQNLNERISQLENDKQSLNESYDLLVLEKNEIQENITLLEAECQKHINSVRYKTGTVITDSLKSPSNFLKSPMRLMRLLKEGRLKQNDNALSKNESEETKPVEEAEPYENHSPVTARFNKEQIVKINNQKISKHCLQEKVDINVMVSIIILNKDGIDKLKLLLSSFELNKFYNNYEIIVVDNNSKDGSVAYLEQMKSKFKLSIIKNYSNETFSKANNDAVKTAKGEYLVFLNNDIEVTEGWLDELLKIHFENENVGAVGAKLIYPNIPQNQINTGKDFLKQHRGISFRYDWFMNTPFIRPFNLGNGEEAFSGGKEVAREIAAVTAAVMLIKKDVFEQISGFDEKYVYGYEDVDLCLRLCKAGYKNYINPKSLLFHYEFGTQTESNNEEIVQRRTNNIEYFRDKWQSYLEQKIWEDKINGTIIFSEEPLTIAFAVTEAGENAVAGDYFTAKELADELELLGYRTKYLCRYVEDWYNVGSEVDVVVSMLDSFDIAKIYNIKWPIKTVAWMRNQFKSWCDQPYIYQFSYLFASSKTACNFVREQTDLFAELFPIATNHKRFNMQNLIINEEEEQNFSSDYTFTGSYWGAPREVIDYLDPSENPYKLKIFGQNWEQISKFKPYHYGFAKYSDMPKIYKTTKLIIDDANSVTKEYGAVNSRVFDAIASDRLVITNGVIGAQETFEGLLPTYSNKEDLKNSINTHLSDDKKRELLVKKLKDFVLENHTYEIRAKYFKNFLKKNLLLSDKSVAIMIPAPTWTQVEQWGDYHFAVALKKQFEKQGYLVEIRILPEWGRVFNGKYVVVLRGLSFYKTKPEHINIMWNISHPDKVSLDEYNSYNAVFVASDIWAKKLKNELKTNVFTMMQCTDPEIFHESKKKVKKYQLLFVGNSRKVYRKIIKDLLPTDRELSVYGTLWDGIIDDKYIKGDHIPNNDLSDIYGDCEILLNDHWDDMREKGFISNRIFDGLASGAFIISDNIEGIENILPKSIITYNDAADLKTKIEFYLDNPQKRQELINNGIRIVNQKHTFRQRVQQMIDFWKSEG